MRIFGRNCHQCDQAPAWAEKLDEKMDLVLKDMGLILQRELKIMSQLTDALDAAEAAAKANSDADDSAEKLVLDLTALISTLKSTGTDPATVQRIDALTTALRARAAQLGAAVAAGTAAEGGPAGATGAAGA